MASDNRFRLLRNILRAFGLAPDEVDDIVNWIADLLAGKNDSAQAQAIEFPYRLRDNFLSPAELSFYGVLKEAVNGRATISSKVGLADLFYVKSEDQSCYRIYTNKIDRKPVDFLLCELSTMRPLAGIELDDKSHQRSDRQVRDEFVDQVFKAAGLPILHVAAKRSYAVAEFAAQIELYLGTANIPRPAETNAEPKSAVTPKTATQSDQTPDSPKCRSKMVLRTAKS